MPDVTILRPTFTLADAVHLAHTHYNLTVTARQLPSERDQNFHLTAQTAVNTSSKSPDAPNP
jgi:Ser/Thr protein kinase RdoA (MazF antagonist)